MDIRQKTTALIDALKAVCRSYGLGNDGNEYKIITQVFLYKFINDKLGHELCRNHNITGNWEKEYSAQMCSELFRELPQDIPRLMPGQLVSDLWSQRERPDFDRVFDNTMIAVSDMNGEVFYTLTAQETHIPLFEKLTPFVMDEAQRAPFARAVIEKLHDFSFEEAFSRGYDFFADIFEYLIKDYNTASGGKYAEYYTPHSVAEIMAQLLADGASGKYAECYDPSAGTGTLLMALAHRIGTEHCGIFAQDISQRSNKMLKLNLILNGLASSLDNAVQGDTLLTPFHTEPDGKTPKKFDYIISNPPFRMDFSDIREHLAEMPERFWAGVPKIPAKKKESMAVYTCFLQHVINSMKPGGRAAVVVPTGFVMAKNGIENAILRHITDNHLVYGCISMPSNLFASTGTNVSVLFLDNSGKSREAVLINAADMGEDYRDNGVQRHRLRENEAREMINAFRSRADIEDFSIVVSHEKIRSKNYSLSAGQYFGVKQTSESLSPEDFSEELRKCADELRTLNAESSALQENIFRQLARLGIREDGE